MPPFAWTDMRGNAVAAVALLIAGAAALRRLRRSRR